MFLDPACFASADNVEEIRSSDSLQYDFNTIEVATRHFSPSNKLGQGGFGAVFKVKNLYVLKSVFQIYQN